MCLYYTPRDYKLIPIKPGKPEDAENYVPFLRAVKAEFSRHNLLVTAAMGAYPVRNRSEFKFNVN